MITASSTCQFINIEDVLKFLLEENITQTFNQSRLRIEKKKKNKIKIYIEKKHFY